MEYDRANESEQIIIYFKINYDTTKYNIERLNASL